MRRLSAWGLEGIGEITRGADLAGQIIEAANAMAEPLADGDVVVVTQKVVSKAEGAMEAVDPADPLSHKPLVERESVRVLRRRGDLLLTETRHGFVCANAGIDLSNVERGLCSPAAGGPGSVGPPDHAMRSGVGPVSRWRWSSRTPSVAPGGGASPTWP